jgi:hypothetical protein
MKKTREVVCTGNNLCRKEDCPHKVKHDMESCTCMGVYICKVCDQAVKCKEIKSLKEPE